jgi:hypothetical protein
MPMPSGIPIIDTMLSVPSSEAKRNYDFMRPLFRDEESLKSFDFPVQYMFKDFPKVDKQEDYITYTLQLMDRFGIERGMTGVTLDDPEANNNLAVRRHPDRFIASAGCDPNRGMEGRSRSGTGAGTRSSPSASSSTWRSSAAWACRAPVFRWRRSSWSRWTRSAGSSRSCASCSATAPSPGRRSRSS